MLIFGELRSKVVKISISGDQIVKRGFGGLGYKYVFYFDEIEGYRISNISSKADTYEYLYLIKDGKKVIKLSQFYHSNYKEIKTEILKKGIRSLGIEQWSLLKETKEIYS